MELVHKRGDESPRNKSLQEKKFDLYAEEVRADIALRKHVTYVHTSRDVFCMLFLAAMIVLGLYGFVDLYTLIGSQAVNALIKWGDRGQSKVNEYLYNRRRE